MGRIKSTKFLGIVICPKCGETGHLKLRRGKYYEVHHYSGKVKLRNTYWKRSGFVGKYQSCCYIGKNFHSI